MFGFILTAMLSNGMYTFKNIDSVKSEKTLEVKTENNNEIKKDEIKETTIKENE